MALISDKTCSSNRAALAAQIKDLRSTVAALTERVAILERPPAPTLVDSPCLTLKTGDALDLLRIDGGGSGICVNSTTNASGTPIAGASIRRCELRNALYGMKIGAGALTSNLVVADVKTRSCVDGLFLADLSDATFDRCDIEGGGTGFDHGVYLERGCHWPTWRNCRIKTFGDGYALHCYAGDPITTEDLLFEDCIFDGGDNGQPLVVCGDFRRVTFRRCTLITAKGVCARLGEGCTDVLFEDCTARGGYAMVGTFANSQVGKITVRRGTYSSTQVLSPYASERKITTWLADGVGVAA